MTIVVCIKCHDGVVVAADSMLSVGELQLSGQKIHLINDNIFAFAGDLGFAERFRAYIDNEEPDHEYHKIEYSTSLGNAFSEHLEKSNIDREKVPLHAVLVHSHNDELEACIYAPFWNPRYLDKDHFFHAIGSGVTAALPFLAFLLKSLDQDKHPPSLVDGKLFAVWAVLYATERLSGGVGGEIDVAIAEKKAGRPVFHELSRDDIEELIQHIATASIALKDWKRALASQDSEEPPRA
jgi:20S proteasome alpha/beta subunit